MPSSDYSSVISGGLKLKGAKDAGIAKKKKKKPKPTSTEPSSASGVDNAGDKADDPTQSAVHKALADEDAVAAEEKGVGVGGEEVKRSGKTEAQKRHEEMRRKRLDERLQKEGIKTHKERVEALNSYLSGLSEHHDMPRIGPG